MKIWCQDKTYDNIKDLPPFDGVSIIQFQFLDQPDYYKRRYIKLCQNSWRVALPDSRIVMFAITDDLINMFKWCKIANSKKFIPDVLRWYIINQFDKALYLDTDVFLAPDFKLYIDKDLYVINNAAGSGIYNKKKGNYSINLMVDFYKELADKIEREGLDFHYFGDVEVLEMFKNKYGKNQIPSIRVTSSYHFSNFYPWVRDDKKINIITSNWLSEDFYNKKYSNVIYYSLFTFEALMAYLTYFEIPFELVTKYNPEHHFIAFV
jgi:hypothetical protein